MSETTNITTKEKTVPERSREIPVIAPVVDIFENDDEMLLYADMPGVAKEDITVNIDNGELLISGVRRLPPSGTATREEFGDVEYRRIFSVHQTIDVEKVNAELKDGVLTLHLPKSEASKPRQIEIH
ncbi:MAG: Hsp20/alpha crystallin family protein [Proteobacteria bacterium]|nr:Hsp20/alpha crystallin family protein [Pseudomonadota bacterium]MBU1060776.1 Hsp20/alpha crystallin family protein [Pseudomonadota bacterium]